MNDFLNDFIWHQEKPIIDGTPAQFEGDKPNNFFMEQVMARNTGDDMKSRMMLDLRAQAIWNKYAMHMYHWLHEHGRIGSFNEQAMLERQRAGEDIVITTSGLFFDEEKKTPVPLRKAYCDPRNQLFYVPSPYRQPSRNYSLEVQQKDKHITFKGWFLDPTKNTNIYPMHYVRELSPELMDRARELVESNPELKNAEKNEKHFAYALAVESMITIEDILAMEIVLVDRASVKEWLSENGFTEKWIWNEALKLRYDSAKLAAGKHDTAFGQIPTKYLKLYFTAKTDPNNPLKEAPINLITSEDFGADKWTVGQYFIYQDPCSHEISVQESMPFCFDWDKHGRGQVRGNYT